MIKIRTRFEKELENENNFIKEKIEEKRGVFNVQMEVRSILGFFALLLKF